jgi:hypothetical protein
MNNTAKLVLFAVALALCIGSIPAGAEAVNAGTVLGSVSETYADCSSCSLITPHGCYILLTPVGGDPIVIHVGADIAESTGGNCSTVLAVDDCVQVTGEIVNGLISAPLPGGYISSFQMEFLAWMKVNSARCSS